MQSCAAKLPNRVQAFDLFNFIRQLSEIETVARAEAALIGHLGVQIGFFFRMRFKNADPTGKSFIIVPLPGQAQKRKSNFQLLVFFQAANVGRIGHKREKVE
jgi:hypothetical protein